jgi:thioredoxin-disulfide reductase
MNTYIKTSITDYKSEIEQSTKTVVLYFYSQDCPTCTAFDPAFNKLAENYNEKFKFVKLLRNVNRQLADKLDVKTSPTVIFMKDGQEICIRLSGSIDSNEFKIALDRAYEGKCERTLRNRVDCDVLIIGGGPAGLSAAIYAARSKLFTVVLDEGITGGQVTTTFHVANYPGTNGVVRGIDLADNMKKQADSFGTQFDELKEISEVDLEGDIKHVKSTDTDYYSKAVIIASGARPRRLPAEGEKDYRGRGIHYCATCDGALYQDADILVVGGGNSALDEAVFLTTYAKHVTIIHHLDQFTGDKASQDKVKHNPSIDVILNSRIITVQGAQFLKSVIVEDTKTHATREIQTDGVFVYIGMEPKTQVFRGKLNIDEYGYILTDENMFTNIPGVFAAGDVRQKKIRQIVTAASDGAIAGIMAEKYINENF